MNSIKLYTRMDTIFMNSKNSKTTDSHRLLLNFSDKIDLKRSDKYVGSLNLSIYQKWENMNGKYEKDHTKIINLKYQL